MQSGSCDMPDLFQNMEKATGFGREYCESIGCEDDDDFLDCIKGKTVDQLVRGRVSPENSPVFGPVMVFTPTVDNTEVGIPKMPLSGILDNQHTKVPLILGSNKDEGSILRFLVPKVVPGVHGTNIKQKHMPEILHHILDPHIGAKAAERRIPEILNDHYPLIAYDNNTNRQLAAVLRDYMFQCSTRRAARAVTSHGTAPAFRYHFSYRNHWGDVQEFGTYHGLDIQFLFGDFSNHGHHRASPKDFEMRSDFGAYWTNVAKYGSPNRNEGTPSLHSDNVLWPSQGEDDEMVLSLNLPLEVIEMDEADVCDFWDEVTDEFRNSELKLRQDTTVIRPE